MASVRYQVDGVHQDSWAHAWFPTPPLSPAGTSSVRYMIHGSPGTERVPSPSPRFDRTASHLAGGPYRNGSDVAPDWFAPQVWFTEIKDMPVGPSSSGLGIRYLPKRVAVEVPPVVPVNAQWGPNGPSPIAMSGRKIGGRRSMHWPRSLIRWPNLRGET